MDWKTMNGRHIQESLSTEDEEVSEQFRRYIESVWYVDSSSHPLTSKNRRPLPFRKRQQLPLKTTRIRSSFVILNINNRQP